MQHNMILAAVHRAGTAAAMNGLLAQDDPRAIAPLRAISRHLSLHAEWYNDLSSLARVAIVRSEPSIAWGEDGGRLAGDVSGHLAEFRGFFECLSALRYPVDLLVAGSLEPRKLETYAVLILPAVLCLSDRDAAALDDYVAAGGCILATGNLAAADETGAARSTAVLASCPNLPGPPRASDGAYFVLASGIIYLTSRGAE